MFRAAFRRLLALDDPPERTALAFSVGLLFAPRVTRFVASLFAALTIADFLQIAYKAAEEKGLG